jgi:AraC-like DNA-binding protein
VNRYLAGYLFVSSLYLLQSFIFLYGVSLNLVAFCTLTYGSIFYLVGPLSFFYVRGVLRDNTKMDKKDWLHFLPFIIFFTGSIPYFFSTWDFKLLVAQNMLSEQWNMSQFDLNIFIPHKVDHVLNILALYFYAGSLWYLIRKHKRNSSSRIYLVPQFKLIRKWLFIFTLIVTIIALNFSVTAAELLIYDEKSVFLEMANGPLFFASIVYVVMNMGIMFFPHIMYGLPLEKIHTVTNETENIPTYTAAETYTLEPQNIVPAFALDVELDETGLMPRLFSDDYIKQIEDQLQVFIEKEAYLEPDFRLVSIISISGIPAHHLSYYFNTILKSSFSDWRNNLRIKYAIQLFNQGSLEFHTLEAVALKSGYSNQNTFIRAFKLSTGKTPSNYVKGLATSS